MSDPQRPPSSHVVSLSDPWLEQRTRLLVGVLGVGASAAAFTFVSQLPNPDPLDAVAMPGLVGVMLLLLALLLRQVIAERLAWRVMYVVTAAYFLVQLNHQFDVYVPVHGHLNQGTYWFVFLYCSAFLAWPRRSAVGAAVFTFGAALLTVLARTPAVLPHLPAGAELVAYAVHFFAAGLGSILLLYHFAVVQERFVQMRLLAFTDTLTGLPNRRYAEETLTRELRGAATQPTATEDGTVAESGPLSVVLIDLDRFKSVNDRFGHETGDQVLQVAGRLIAQRLRGDQQAVRWGGEEFLLLLPRTGALQAEAVAERIRQDLESHEFEVAGTLTASFGVAVQRPGDTPERLVRRADANLYRAKQTGRNRVKMPTMF